MPLPVETDRKIRNSFEELIMDAEAQFAALNVYDEKHDSRYREWVVKTSGLVSMLFGNSEQGEKYQQIMDRRRTGYGGVAGKPHSLFSESIFREKLATLKGIRHNYINGFYISLEKQIIANVSADYMEQAEALLQEGFHALAAVSCGMVLENRLRSYCENLEPPIETVKPNGESKTLGALIGELDRVKAFDKQTRKMLRAWADIRNAAAHGRDDEFTREQVELMLLGVNGFLANHL